MSIELTKFARCKRCGQLCRPGKGNPNSRPFRKAAEGLCVNCAITQFLKETIPLNNLLSSVGPDVLLREDLQQQVGNIMTTGNCDASLSEISWQIVVDQWDLPMPKLGGLNDKTNSSRRDRKV